jgi:hypothetical protein
VRAGETKRTIGVPLVQERNECTRVQSSIGPRSRVRERVLLLAVAKVAAIIASGLECGRFDDLSGGVFCLAIGGVRLISRSLFSRWNFGGRQKTRPDHRALSSTAQPQQRSLNSAASTSQPQQRSLNSAASTAQPQHRSLNTPYPNNPYPNTDASIGPVRGFIL